MSERRAINFVDLAAALLDRAHTLVPQWLPHGQERGGRWYVGDFDGSPGESANVHLATGRWYDNAGGEEDKGGDLISLYARIRGLTNGEAARELMRDMGWDRSQASAPASDARRGQAATPPGGPPEPPPEGEPAPRVKKKSIWQAITPVPRHAPPATFVFGYRDDKTGQWVELEAVKTWAYEFEGQLFGHVARFERFSSSTGELVKDTVPRTWCVDTSDGQGSQRWHWKAWDSPRPLFVPATLLAGDPALVPVVVVEGEKCAEAGHQLLGHEFDFVSWPGGCKTWAMAAWAWLKGRQVILWPDCDAKREPLTKAERALDVPPVKPLLPPAKQPGMRAMVNIGSLLQAEHGCSVRMCVIPEPGEAADGWDIADAIAEGADAANVRRFINAAVPFRSPDESVRAATGGSGDGKKPPRSRAGADEGSERADADRRDWTFHLLESSTGATKAVRENVVLALDGWPEKGVPGILECAGLIGFNEFTNNIEKRRPAPWGSPAGAWLEEDELSMGDWLVRTHFLPSMSRSHLEEAVRIVASRHAFHPVREEVEGARGTWDGVKRLDTWLRRTCLEEDEHDERAPLQQYLALAGRWFVMGMCARVLQTKKEGARIVRGPGTKFDYMLVFEGKTGWGKSTLAAVMGGEYFADTGLMLGEKDSYQNIQGVRVYEWGELENMSKQEVSKVKLFISSPKDRFRASFDRRPKDYPRQVVFVGTTNESHYLSDLTGNRRFWPVRVTRPPDAAWLRIHWAQLVAEALACLDAGERFWPTFEEQERLFDPQQRSRTVTSSIESAIRQYLYDEDQKVPHGGDNGALRNEVSMTELLNRIGYTIDKQTDVIVKKAGAVMHMLGWELKRTSKPGRPYTYRRPEDDRAGDAGASDGFDDGRPPQGDDSKGTADVCPF